MTDDVGLSDEELHVLALRASEPEALAGFHVQLAKHPDRADLVRRYPVEFIYRVLNDAPYRLTVAGSIVSIVSYFGDGKVGVVLLRYPASVRDTIRELTGSDNIAEYRIPMDPQWLEPYIYAKAIR